MTEQERKYRRIINRIGAAMLIFLAVINLLVSVWQLVCGITERVLDPVTAEIINQILYAIVYLASFFIPALLIKPLLRSDYRPIMLKKTLPRETPLYIFGGIAVILMMAYLNADFVSIFNYSEFSSEYLWGNEPLENYQVALEFLTTAIVPGICEEFLFRGAILSNLRRFGKAPAIIISALLFGLMHQNAEQFLYATAAGLVLGWVAYETGSVFCGMLIHFSNNFFSVAETVLDQRIPGDAGLIVCYSLEAAMVIAGFVSVIIIICRHSKKTKISFADGIYAKPLSDFTDPDAPECALGAGKAAKLFFSPCMIIFICLAVFEMLALIVMSLLSPSLSGILQ